MCGSPTSTFGRRSTACAGMTFPCGATRALLRSRRRSTPTSRGRCDAFPCLHSFLFDCHSGRFGHFSRSANALKLARVLDLAIEEVAEERAYCGDGGESTDFIPCRRERRVHDI